MKNQGLIGALRLFAVLFICGGGLGVIVMLGKASEVSKYSRDAGNYFINSAIGTGLLVAAVATLFFGVAQVLEEVSREGLAKAPKTAYPKTPEKKNELGLPKMSDVEW